MRRPPSQWPRPPSVAGSPASPRMAVISLLTFVGAFMLLSGCIGGEEPLAAQAEAIPPPAPTPTAESDEDGNATEAPPDVAPNATGPAPSESVGETATATTPAWRWEGTYKGSFSEIEVTGNGPPIAQGNGRNCVVLDGAGFGDLAGMARAEWTALAPNAAQLQLVIMLGSDVVATAEGASPLELQFPERAEKADRVSVFVGAPRGVSLVVAQEVAIAIDVRYEAEAEGDTLQGNCVLAG